MQKNSNSFLVFFGGILGGLCISLLLGMGLFYLRASKMTLLVPTSIPTSQLPTLMPIPSPMNQLDEAELALYSGYPEQVRELLYPEIEQWTSNDDLLRGYRLLGEAELAQGHAKLAVPYLEKLYFYGPTAENLFLLATVYDAGGNSCLALTKYQELQRWENLPEEVDIEFVNMRVHDISCALGTKLPTYTPFP